MTGLTCPKCSGETIVTDSRPANGAIRRRRECHQCGHRLTTYETANKKATPMNVSDIAAAQSLADRVAEAQRFRDKVTSQRPKITVGTGASAITIDVTDAFAKVLRVAILNDIDVMIDKAITDLQAMGIEV